MSKRRRTPNTTAAVIEELFQHSPVNEAELGRRLNGIEEEGARQALVEKLASGTTEEGQVDLLVAALRRFGTGGQRDRLIALVADRSASELVRSTAMGVLLTEDPSLGEELAGKLSAEEMLALSEAPLVELMAHIQEEPESAQIVVEMLESVAEGDKAHLLERLGHHRRRAGVPAILVYEPVLAEEKLSKLRPAMLEAIVAESAPGSAAVLERLRGKTKSDAARQDYQRALMKLRTRVISGERTATASKGYAYLGSCDGQGAYILVGCFENPDASLTVADLVIRAAADVRDGFVLPRQSTASR
jgi:hypothetical protein